MRVYIYNAYEIVVPSNFDDFTNNKKSIIIPAVFQNSKYIRNLCKVYEIIIIIILVSRKQRVPTLKLHDIILI